MIKTLLRHSSDTVPDARPTPAPPDGGPTAQAVGDPGRTEPSSAEVARCLSGQALLWLDLEDPTPEEFARLQREFGFHPLAIEDALRANQRPKVDEYPGYYFLVFYAVDLESGQTVRAQQISLFLGSTYLITAHRGPAPEIAESARRWEKNQGEVGNTIGAILYSVLDAIVDNYFPVIDRLVERIEGLEEEILERCDRRTLSRLFDLKRNLLTLRRQLGPERDVLNVLIRREAPVVDATTGLYLQDVYDHVNRVIDTVDLYRDLLSGALDAYLSVTSNNLNQVMKRMTAIATILMSLALIAGIYGMNFHDMPELAWTYGYAYALTLMAVLGGGLAIFFRRIGWF